MPKNEMSEVFAGQDAMLALLDRELPKQSKWTEEQKCRWWFGAMSAVMITCAEMEGFKFMACLALSEIRSYAEEEKQRLKSTKKKTKGKLQS